MCVVKEEKLELKHKYSWVTEKILHRNANIEMYTEALSYVCMQEIRACTLYTKFNGVTLMLKGSKRCVVFIRTLFREQGSRLHQGRRR